MEDAQAETVVGQTQRRGFLKAVNDADVVAIDLKVSPGSSAHAEAVVDVLKDTVGWQDWLALAVSQNDAKLKLLEIFVAIDSTDNSISVSPSGHIGLEFATPKLELLVLCDRSIREALGVNCEKYVLMLEISG